ncbi:MAG: Glycosyl transferase group 1 [Parcubacteria group bacterium Gr01-1014_13]|nr:MAG: Glycosyl transferase group 1 [Parcubacteria group bacterium Gr01-1014_13]
MKIAHVVSTFFPHVGGMGTVCYNEVKRLAENGHDVTVFTLKYPDTTYEDTKFPFKVVRLKPLIKLGDAGLVPQILNQLTGFDLVHLHYPFYGGAEWLCFSSVPTVITYHMDAQAEGIKGLISKIYDLLWPRILFSQAKKIVAVNAEHFKNTKFGKGFADKTIEIQNGVDMEIFNPHEVNLEALGLVHLKDKKIILFVGNLMPVKRLDMVLDSIKLLGDDNLALVVVGGGYELDKYKELAKDLNNVYFVGQCDDQKKLSDYYNAAACVVVPSDYESFSLVAIEAGACGIPVVASNIPAMAERINNGVNGFLFEKGSVESLTAAFRKIMSMSAEERKVIGQQGRVGVENKYSWKKHMEKLINLYGV